MAKITFELIQALRNTARQLETSTFYQWGHMGLCNCGFLAQQVTALTKEEIHTRAMQGHGDWTEQLNDYCPSSGLPMDDLISALLDFGFSRQDLAHLEKLAAPAVLQALPAHRRYLKHNLKEDAVLYLNTWAALLESELISQVEIGGVLAKKGIQAEHTPA